MKARHFKFDLDSIQANASRIVATACEVGERGQRKDDADAAITIVITAHPDVAVPSYVSHEHDDREAIVGAVSPEHMGQLVATIARKRPVSITPEVAKRIPEDDEGHGDDDDDCDPESRKGKPGRGAAGGGKRKKSKRSR